MYHAEVRGFPIAYQRAGRGPPLLLLHGFLVDSRMWRPQLESLSNEFTVIAWDAPGAGQSADPPEPFGTDDWADCLAGLLEVVGVESTHVVGLSWGGMLAQELYRRRPERVRSLTLVGTYAGWRRSLGEAIAEERLATCLRDSSLPAAEVVAKYLPGMLGESATQAAREELARIMADFHPTGFRLMAMSSAEVDTHDILREIRVPTLLVWGDADTRSPMTVARQFHTAIPGARLAVIPGAGHVTNVDAPARFNAEVRDFCAGGHASAMR
jgi:pimeloyl-ACP methyl ester carboxylesterase